MIQVSGLLTLHLRTVMSDGSILNPSYVTLMLFQMIFLKLLDQ